MKLSLDQSVGLLPGVGPARLEQLEALGISTLRDLLFYPPFRYETVERSVKIADLVADTTACFQAHVVSKFPIQSKRFRSMLKVKVADETGTIDLTWFNTPFILNSLKVGDNYYFTGKISAFKGKNTITNPTVEKETPLFGSLVPVYHESADITSRMLRKMIAQALAVADTSEDIQMQFIVSKYDYLDLNRSLHILHNPESEDLLKRAKERLAFDEMFYLIQHVMEEKKIHESAQTIGKLKTTNQDIQKFLSFLPYAPTESQLEAIHAIALDLVQSHPMHRLLQGEVGSGKTTVAAFALWVAALQKRPAVLICPTKILASQHFETLKKLFQTEVRDQRLEAPSIGLYTGKEKSIDADIIIGTHALFHAKKLKPSLVVIDEEHRFGVNQRAHFFTQKKKPHFLSMTATPIPRTVALTALADRDISQITPHKSNTNIKTWVVPKAKRTDAYAWIKTTLKDTGGQALIICPFIEESAIETLNTVKSAKKEFDHLQKVFPSFKLQLLHGKLKEEEKDSLFAGMMAGKTDILVTTPVVEVGVDIPKANVIVIEGAERFGLAGLHQLRGRVGRRGQEAFCLLFTSEGIEQTGRLTHFASTYDGNKLAEFDLKNRGSGELLGVRQHGFDTLKFASWFDEKLITRCKEEVLQLLESKSL